MSDKVNFAVEALAQRLPSQNSAALITSPVSLRYLCGFPIDSGIILISKEARLLFVPEQDLTGVKARASGLDAVALTADGQMLDVLIKFAIKRVYVEADKMTVAQFNIFKEQLHYASLITTGELDRVLLELRSVKAAEEISSITAAQAICDKAFDKVLGQIHKEMSERRIASMLRYYLMKYGSEGDIDVTVLSGENTANTRLKPSGRKITDGDFLILEFGARKNGYCAKMCRTLAVGRLDSRREDAYNAVACAVQDGLKALRAGTGSKVADSVAHATLGAWGVDEYCSTSFASGIGLEETEPPYLGRGASVNLKANTVLFVKCGINVAGKYGVRIGDMVVLTDVGCNNLTSATKSLIHI